MIDRRSCIWIKNLSHVLNTCGPRLPLSSPSGESPEAAQDKWRSVGTVEESNRTMDVLVRRGLPPRSWQAEESRTRMSKVLLKRRLPWPSGLILAAFDAIL